MANTLLRSATLAAILAASALPSLGQGILTIHTDKSEATKRIANSGPTCRSMEGAIVEARKLSSSPGKPLTNHNDAVYMIFVAGRGDYSKTQTSPGYYRSNDEVYGLLRSSQESIKEGLSFFRKDIIDMLIPMKNKPNVSASQRTPSYLDSTLDKPFFVSTNLSVILSGYEKLRDSLNAEKELCESLRRKSESELLGLTASTNTSRRISLEEKDIYRFLKDACPLRVQELDKELTFVNKTIDNLSYLSTKQKAKEMITSYNEHQKIRNAEKEARAQEQQSKPRDKRQEIRQIK